MIVVRKIAGLATIQDEGRAGFASQGVPRGGALVRSLARRANAAVGNAAAAACVEVFGRLLCVAERDVLVATDRGDARRLRAGEELAIDPDPGLRVRYLAIAGGVQAPLRLGGRSTLLVAGLGRALRAGDAIESAGAADAPRARESEESRGPIRLVAGPDHPDVANLIAGRPWRIGAASDRTGTRLEGDPIANAPAPTRSSPMICGALQLPPAGTPIVIGPDGPTTGGYPIVAVLARADRDRFHALPIGAAVRFEVLT